MNSGIEVGQRPDDLERRTEGLALSHDTFSRGTQIQLEPLFDAIRELMTPTAARKRLIRFVTHENTADKGSARCSVSVPQVVEQRLGFDKVQCIEALGEGTVYGCEQVRCLLPFAALGPQSREVSRRAQLKR